MRIGDLCRTLVKVTRLVLPLAALLGAFSLPAHALPAYARQTGQNCVACHAGGQFPELTPYGRMFKLTGYTMGDRAIPISVMGVASLSKVRNMEAGDPNADFYKNGLPVVATGSVFLAGKVTDNLGLFSQVTYDNYASQNAQGEWAGHTAADNMDIRYADRFISPARDLILGVSLNNNPSVTDVWNTAAAWMQYVPVPSPSSSQFIDGNAPYPGYGAGGNLTGLNAYAYLNQTIYLELGAYRTANKLFSFMSAGLKDNETTKLRGLNPYWRLTYTKDRGAHSFMVGTSGMYAKVYDLGSDISDSGNLGKFRNIGLDAQYQYILSPHVITAQIAYMHQRQDYSPNAIASIGGPANASDTTQVERLKASYVYGARYGGSLSLFNQTGTSNPANVSTTPVNGSATGNPSQKGMTPEVFWTPVEYARIGAQCTLYGRYNGGVGNYDGNGRNAKDNDTLFLYVWAAY